ncbi:MAG: hypothetical protein MUP02_05090, partial [Actinobacteria bacterium]|nr:hypothetical protein [Actinomycetota bacterium]
MKRTLLWVVVVVMSLSMIAMIGLSGCKEDAAGGDAGTAELKKAEDITIGFSLWTMQFTFFQNV